MDQHRPIKAALSALAIAAGLTLLAGLGTLARADLAQGETRNARARLEMVVEQGGTLYIVEEARELLAELE